MWKEFKEFAFKGNVMDMAVGVMIGGAFGKIVTSVVDDLFMPILSLITGRVDFASMFIAMDGGEYASLAAAEEAGVATFNYGAFFSTLLDFLLMAFCVFLFVKFINRLRDRKKEEPAPEAPKPVCPFCRTEIDPEATRCPHCTSDLSGIAKEA